MESWVMVRKKGPRMGMVIIRSKSTSRSEPSCAKPWVMAVLRVRVRVGVGGWGWGWGWGWG